MTTKNLGIKGQNVFFYVALGLAIFTNIWMALMAYMQYNWYPDNSSHMLNKVIIFTLLTSVIFKFQKIRPLKLILLVLSDLILLVLMFRLTNNGKTFDESIAVMGLKNTLIMCVTLVLLGMDWMNRLRIIKKYESTKS